MRNRLIAVGFCLLAFSSVAHAQDSLGQEAVAPPSEEVHTPLPAASAKVDLKKEKDKSAAKKTSTKRSLTWSGRVFAGDTLTRREVAGSIFWRNEQAVSSARVGLRYEHEKGVKAVIKIEVSDGDADLKDGYIRLELPSNFRVQAGRFKKPISSIALASKWDLPSVERGLLDSVTVEGQKLPFDGGRGEGLQLAYRAPLARKAGVTLALFQNKLGVGEVTLDAKDDFAQDAFARVYVEPVEGLQFASTFASLGYLANGTRESFRHAPVGTLELQYESEHVRAWAEAMIGKSPFARVDGSTEGNFWAARSLLALHLRTGIPRRLEPFIGASAFDPRTSDANNANYEIMGGVNLAFAKDWRLQLEVAQTFAEGLSASATESTAIRLQLGARLRE